MKWLDKLERKLKPFAVKNLMLYIVSLNLAVFLLLKFDQTNTFWTKLLLIPSYVLQGEVWRLFTHVLIPPSTSTLWILFILYFYYMIGTTLEHEWGSVRFNLYYLIGFLCTTAAAFITGGTGASLYLNTSLFLAFARLYPDYQILLFFILPVKMKYLAWFNWFMIAYTTLFEPLPFKGAAIASVIGYFIFFGKDILTNTRSTGRSYYNKQKFQSQLPKKQTIHKCTICGLTEKDDPQMDFRYCVDCEGDYEYCMPHLENHEHIKK